MSIRGPFIEVNVADTTAAATASRPASKSPMASRAPSQRGPSHAPSPKLRLLTYSHTNLRLDEVVRGADDFDYTDISLQLGSARGSRSCLALDVISPRTSKLSPRQLRAAIKEGGDCAKTKDWSHAAAAFQDALNSNPFEPVLGDTFLTMLDRLRRDRFYFTLRRKRGDFLDVNWRPPTPPPAPPPEAIPESPPPMTPPEEARKTIKDEFEEVYKNIFLKDLLPRRKDESLQQDYQLRALLWRYYFYARRVFKFYARIETPAPAKLGSVQTVADPLFTVEKREWLNFVKDTRFENQVLTKAIIDIIYITANREIDRNGVPIEDDSTEGNSKASCMLHEFLATIVRMANERFRKLPTLPERVRQAYEELIIPNARVDDEAGLKFEFIKRETQAAVQPFRPLMVDIFRTFSMLDWQQGNKDNSKLITMSFREFNAFAEFYSLVDDILTVKELQDAFVLAQRDPYVHFGKPPPNGEVTDAELLEQMGALDASDPTELQFEDFEESVLRLGMVKIPNAAAKPLPDVIRTFFGKVQDMTPAVMAKIKAEPSLKAPDTLRARADAMWAERERKRAGRRAQAVGNWESERRARSTQPSKSPLPEATGSASPGAMAASASAAALLPTAPGLQPQGAGSPGPGSPGPGSMSPPPPPDGASPRSEAGVPLEAPELAPA